MHGFRKSQAMQGLQGCDQAIRHRFHETGMTSAGVIRLPRGQHVRQRRGDSSPMGKSVTGPFPKSSNLGEAQGPCQAQAMS